MQIHTVSHMFHRDHRPSLHFDHMLSDPACIGLCHHRWKERSFHPWENSLQLLTMLERSFKRSWQVISQKLFVKDKLCPEFLILTKCSSFWAVFGSHHGTSSDDPRHTFWIACHHLQDERSISRAMGFHQHG